MYMKCTPIAVLHIVEGVFDAELDASLYGYVPDLWTLTVWLQQVRFSTRSASEQLVAFRSLASNPVHGFRQASSEQGPSRLFLLSLLVQWLVLVCFAGSQEE